MNIKQLLGAVAAMIIKIGTAAVIIIAVFRISVYAYDFGYQIFADIPVSEGEGRIVSVVVAEGQGSREIARLLEQRGLINDANVFFIQERLSNNKGRLKIKPGTYELSTAMNAEQILAILRNVREGQ